MSNGNYVTNKELYDRIEDLRHEIIDEIKGVKKCVDENTTWRNRIVGQFTIVVIIIGAAVNWFFSLLDK